MNKIAVFGACSTIAYETLKLFAKDGAAFYLCDRDEDELKRLSGDLSVRGAGDVGYSVFNALDERSISEAVENILSKHPDLDGLFIAYGTLPDQKRCETDIREMNKAFTINFTSTASILTQMADHFVKQKHGTIAVISSVAGDRGRESNYVYGSVKSALTAFTSGLRQRLCKAGVHVLTIKPGMVDTPMTADFKKGILFSQPDVIGKGIYNAILKKKNIVYLPWFWRWIMFIIRNIPERIFKKITL
ncbi:MAG: SDR family oxidoreductase [Nitrospirae bacterium]|nr:SDR family oxidoreductase [Nitrospirota bacterium]